MFLPLKLISQDKTIRCLGGIEWGFELHFTRIRPVAINPKLLNLEDWKRAWEFVKEKLPDYTYNVIY